MEAQQFPMKLRLISPFRCQLKLDSAAVNSQAENYKNFLREIKEKTSKPGEGLLCRMPKGVEFDVNVLPLTSSTDSRYISLAAVGSHFQSPRLFNIHIREQEEGKLEKVFQEAKHIADKRCENKLSHRITPIVESIHFSFYDNTIGMMDIELALEETFPEPWIKLEEWTTYFIAYVLSRYYYPEYIYPVLQEVTAFSQTQNPIFIIKPEDYIIFHDMRELESLKSGNVPPCKLMWVNRTLVCKQGHAIAGWIPTLKDNPVEVDKALVHLSWGNNVVETTKDEEEHNLVMLWRGMHLAQYYYAAMDVISSNLTRFMAITYTSKDNEALKEVSFEMEMVVSSVTILQIKYEDLHMELQGVIRQVFMRLEKEWDFHTIFANVQHKMNVCKANTTHLNQVINHRNQARANMVLTSLTGVGIVNLMVGIAAYAQRIRADPATDVKDVPGIMDIALGVSANMMIWIGIAIAVVTAAIVIKNRSS